jgi:hypothetical protein
MAADFCKLKGGETVAVGVRALAAGKETILAEKAFTAGYRKRNDDTVAYFELPISTTSP